MKTTMYIRGVPGLEFLLLVYQIKSLAEYVRGSAVFTSGLVSTVLLISFPEGRAHMQQQLST